MHGKNREIEGGRETPIYIYACIKRRQGADGVGY
jgi:hypothetical protein